MYLIKFTVLESRSLVTFLPDILMIHLYITRSDWIFSWSSSVIKSAKITDSAVLMLLVTFSFRGSLNFSTLRMEGRTITVSSHNLIPPIHDRICYLYRWYLFIWACRCFLFGYNFWHLFFLQGMILNESDNFSNSPGKWCPCHVHSCCHSLCGLWHFWRKFKYIYIYMIYEILKLAFFPVIFYLWQNMIIRDSKHQYYGKEISIYWESNTLGVIQNIFTYHYI